MTLKGVIYSVMQDEFVIQTGKELYHIRKDALPADQRAKFEQAGTHEIVVQVPMDSITRVRGVRESAVKTEH